MILPLTGKYTITVGGKGQGNYELLVERVATSAQASIEHAAGISYGEQQSGALTDKILAQAWVFMGKAGDRVAVQAAPASGSAGRTSS